MSEPALTEGLAAPLLLGLYLAVLGGLLLFGAHRLRLVALAHQRRRSDPPPPSPARWPRVTVQLPIYNEWHVLPRLLEAVARLDYPSHLLEVQLLDDSDDETRKLAASWVERLRARGMDIIHLARATRVGFKAGALQAGLERARGELIAVFDADFVPPPDFLRRAVPALTSDPRAGMVQARWGHLNRSYSLLTEVQALMLDGHFLVEHVARSTAGLFFNFNGTAGIRRRRTIEEAGGWQADTLTEDLDLSYRAQLAGWRFVYLPDLVVPAELPVDVNAFKTQQRRWAKGSIQTARKLLPTLLKAPLGWRVKLETAFHLTQNLAYPLLLALGLLLLPMANRFADAPGGLLLVLPALGLGSISVVVFYAVVAARGPDRLGRLALVPALMATGAGLAVSNGLAVLEAVWGHRTPFERTPKTGVTRRGQSWSHRLYRGSSGLLPLYELGLGLYVAVATCLALGQGHYHGLPVFLLFLSGCLGLGCASLLASQRARGSGRSH